MPTSPKLVPSPRWGTYWKTTKTLKGFKKTEGAAAYRNAILQMLLHLPVFLNWVRLWVIAHVDPEGECPNGRGPETTEDQDTRCKVCLLHDLIDAFWDPKGDKDDLEIALGDFWDEIFDDWLEGKAQDGNNYDGQQEIPKLISDVFNQLSEDLPNSFVESLDVQLTEDQESQTLEDLIKNSFVKYPIEDACTACKENALETGLVLTEVPEVLLVHLDRVGERDTESGETEEFNVDSEITFPEEVVIKKAWLDPELGAIRKDINQESGWDLTLADDAHLRTYKSFKEMAGTKIIRETAYVFAYRRLPLVTRGPEISLKKSLQNAKYSDPDATETYDKMELDEAPAQTDPGTMDIDAFGTNPVNKTLFGPNPANTTSIFGPLPRPSLFAPKVVQQNDETEIELDEKQRGTLEVRFTTNTGVTTLKVHVKGMLWNELNDKSQARGTTGGRPVTRSVATSKQASEVVPTKPLKINPKAGIREKSSSKLVNGKKGQLEKISARSPGKIVKRDAPKKGVRK